MPNNSYSNRFNFAALAALVLVLTLILLNIFETDAQRDAGVEINLAGRQQMLTQRMHKLLLQLQDPRTPADRLPEYRQALQRSATLFNTTLQAFSQGGRATTSSAQEVQIKPVSDKAIASTLMDAQRMWQNYDPLLRLVLNSPGTPPLALTAAVQHANQYSEELLNSMDRLTQQLTQLHDSQSYRLLWIELLSFSLALLLLAWGTWYKRQGRLNLLEKIDVLQTQVDEKDKSLSVIDHQLNAIIETAPDLIWMKDTNGIYQSCNQPFATYMGAECASIVGKTDFELSPGAQAERYREHDRRTIAAQKTTTVEEWHRPAKGGPAGLFEIIKTPVYDASGLLIGVQGIGRDISARRQAETALHRSQQQQRLLEQCIAKLNDVVVITEAEPFERPGPRILFVNDAYERVTGYSRAEVLGQTPRLLQGPKTQHAEIARIKNALRTWQPVQAELINYKKNGDEFWNEISISPVADEKGWFTHWISIHRDITARKKAEAETLELLERAQEASRLKSEFLSSISHEMRTPMNAIIGLGQLLQDSALTSQQATFVNHIVSAGQDYMQVIDKALDFSQLESGRMAILMKNFALQPLLQSLEQMTASKASSKNLSLHSVLDPALPTHILGDERRIAQCLHILLDNAVKFTAHGGIALTVKAVSIAHQPWIRFEVKDTGIGLSEVVRERLFHPFVQGDGSMTRKYGGIGLGLVVCRQLVELMQGCLGLDSTPGLGSTFWFELPLKANT